MNNIENSRDINNDLKKQEIKRLTTPLKRPKFIIGSVYDGEGHIVQPTISLLPPRFKYILEPRIGVLTDNEILQYARESKTASEVRLRNGVGNIQDKIVLYGNKILGLWVFIGIGGSIFFGTIAFIIGLFFQTALINTLFVLLFTLGIPTIYHYYIFYLKNYKKIELKNRTSFIEDSSFIDNNLESKSINGNSSQNKPSFSNHRQSLETYKKQINQLEISFKKKEKMARELIEKRFSPPQLTYDRFIVAIDNSHELFYSQLSSAFGIMELATEPSIIVVEEIENKIDTLKSIVEKVDTLTNELALNLTDSEQYSQEVKELLDDIQELTDSVKEYD